MQFFINNQKISQEQILDWEFKRLIITFKRLKKIKFELGMDFKKIIKTKKFFGIIFSQK